METYVLYKKARNKAWKILIKYKLLNFPIDLNALCKKLKITLLTFSQAEKLTSDKDSEAFSIQSSKGNYILYNENIYQKRIRFNIAHEIGHIILKHKSVKNDYTNNQANIFARCLFMPAIVCKVENLTTPQQIAEFFNVSAEAATIRANRIAELLKRYKWLTSPLERRYFELYTKTLH